MINATVSNFWSKLSGFIPSHRRLASHEHQSGDFRHDGKSGTRRQTGHQKGLKE
jgi:hypothetical protein